ncbi:MAG: hypothetical protein IPO94_07550 [Saprospiraceae bacterium]|nr:hypothetical protein [Saprospiraceae bacterium]
MMAAAILAQRSAFDPIKLAADFQRIFTLFSETKDRGNFLEQLFVYVVNVSDISKFELNEAIESIPSKIKDDIMTTYSRIRQEGEQIGIQKGIFKNQVQIVLNCHENKIPVPLIANITQLSEIEVISILKDNGKISK